MSCRCLPGPNPYRDQVQGKALEAQAVVELLRRGRGAVPDATEVVARLVANAPRVAIISGSLDHTAHLRDYETVVLLAAEIWRQGGVPFTFGLPTVCDGTAQSTIGISYSLGSRNLAAEAVVMQMEAHGYHAAVVIQGCDKTPMAVLHGLLMLDRLRRARGEPPVCALFAPVHVLRGGTLSAETRQMLLDLAARARKRAPEIAAELRETLSSVLLCTTNQAYQGILERAVHARIATRREKLDLESRIAASTGHHHGGMCAFNGTGNSTRFVMAALGLVHPDVELLCRPVNADEIARMLADFLPHVGRSRQSVLSLVTGNFANAVRAHSVLGGSMNLVLHLTAAMNYAGFRFSVREFFRIKDAEPLPDLFRYSLLSGRDVFAWAKEHKKREHRGIESVYRVLRDLGVTLELGADTVIGKTWRTRLRGAPRPRSALLSEAPLRDHSGIDCFRGNVFSSAVVKISGMAPEQVRAFDRRVYAVVWFENEARANATLLREDRIIDSLAKGLDLKTLRAFARKAGAAGARRVPRSKRALVEWLMEERRLPVAFVIAGQGPRAFGIPEMFTPMQHINANHRLREVSVLLTDGRYSGVTQGPAFGHVVPEALDEGGILYLRDGDLLQLDFRSRRVDLLDRESFCDGRRKRVGPDWPTPRRRQGRARLKRMLVRRSEIASMSRLDHVTNAEFGIVPISVRSDAKTRFAAVPRP